MTNLQLTEIILAIHARYNKEDKVQELVKVLLDAYHPTAITDNKTVGFTRSNAIEVQIVDSPPRKLLRDGHTFYIARASREQKLRIKELYPLHSPSTLTYCYLEWSREDNKFRGILDIESYWCHSEGHDGFSE